MVVLTQARVWLHLLQLMQQPSRTQDRQDGSQAILWQLLGLAAKSLDELARPECYLPLAERLQSIAPDHSRQQSQSVLPRHSKDFNV
jgi:hypothetical protein